MDLQQKNRTKIVATIGPSSRDSETLRSLFRAGVNVTRLNFSHGTHSEHGELIARIRSIATDLGLHVAILQDLPGPKVRTGGFAPGVSSVILETGRHFSLATEAGVGDETRVSVSYAGLADDVTIGNRLYLADGAIALRIVGKTSTRIDTHIEVGGELRATQGINYPDGTLHIESVTSRDLEHLAFGLEQGVDWVAVSFVKSPEDVSRVKRVIAEKGASALVIAKIEKHEALACIDQIIETADGIMVARGDLGIEIPLEQVPLVQKDLILRANRASKPVITATQMLESMTNSPRPTRAETTDVANAILDGTDAVMLSGETARGAFPVDAVRMMATIAHYVEGSYPHDAMLARRISPDGRSIETTIAESAARATAELGLRFIVSGTMSGSTARHIASFRPLARVLAMTPRIEVARQLALIWGVESMIVDVYHGFEEMLTIVESRLVQEDLVHSKESVVITSGMPVGTGGTNVMKIHIIP
ncbi:MAG TPA: pyruvate kinase [Candidatus Baltobacteraceae bacterium]|jgi:pyruvate kinase|nr:pyruvate kinase [Candidatus Baltobacteraceae bacterium]